MITVHGAITLTSTLHTSAGFQGLRLTSDGKVTSSDKERDSVAVVSTLTTPLTVRGRYYGQVPIYPASSIIGAMRRAAAMRVRNALLADQKKLPVQLYYAFTHGQPASSQLGSTITLEQFNASRSNFFFGLFGGASLRNASQFVQSDMTPIIAATLDASLVPQRFSDLAPVAQHAIEPHHLLQYRVMRKMDDLRRGRDPLAAEDVMLQEINPDDKTEAAAAYQIVPTGTSFYFKLELKESVSTEQRGLLLLALKDWIEQGQIGARAHLGWGKFTAHRFRYIHGQQRHDLFDAHEDEDGIVQLVTTTDFDQLTADALALLDQYSKAPSQHREQYAQLLRGE